MSQFKFDWPGSLLVVVVVVLTQSTTPGLASLSRNDYDPEQFSRNEYGIDIECASPVVQKEMQSSVVEITRLIRQLVARPADQCCSDVLKELQEVKQVVKANLKVTQELKNKVHQLSSQCTHKDVDECAEGTHNCGANAYCTNTDAGFRCTCNTGYQGNGYECSKICRAPNLSLGDECFSLQDQRLSWNEARKKCQTLGGDLAEPRDPLLLIANSRHKFRGEVVFLGASDKLVEGKWLWVSGSPMVMSKPPWDKNQPQGGSEDCLAYDFTELLHDYPCSSKHKFICEL